MSAMTIMESSGLSVTEVSHCRRGQVNCQYTMGEGGHVYKDARQLKESTHKSQSRDWLGLSTSHCCYIGNLNADKHFSIGKKNKAI